MVTSEWPLDTVTITYESPSGDGTTTHTIVPHVDSLEWGNLTAYAPEWFLRGNDVTTGAEMKFALRLIRTWRQERFG